MPRYRDAIDGAITEWEKGGCFRSKSAQSQTAVDVMNYAMRDPMDDDLSWIVDWLLGYVLEKPVRYSYLQPIKAKCKLRTVLEGAIAHCDPPMKTVVVKRKKKTVRVPTVSPSSSSSVGPPPVVRTPTVVVRPTPSSSEKTPLLTPTPKPLVVVQPIVVVARERHLMIDSAEVAPAEIIFSWDQLSLFHTLKLPEETYNGFCNSAVGKWFSVDDPDTYGTFIKKVHNQISIKNVHDRYRGAYFSKKTTSYDFITAEFGLTFVHVSDVFALSARNVLAAMEARTGTRFLIGLIKSSGGGHAVGVWKTGSTYRFFDPNEGMACATDRGKFWTFLWKYIDDHERSLSKTYTTGFVATWS